MNEKIVKIKNRSQTKFLLPLLSLTFSPLCFASRACLSQLAGQRRGKDPNKTTEKNCGPLSKYCIQLAILGIRILFRIPRSFVLITKFMSVSNVIQPFFRRDYRHLRQVSSKGKKVLYTAKMCILKQYLCISSSKYLST